MNAAVYRAGPPRAPSIRQGATVWCGEGWRVTCMMSSTIISCSVRWAPR